MTDDLLLQMWHFFDRHTHPEIAARHHDRVRDGNDLVEVLNALGGLDLGHHHHVIARQHRSRRDHVVGRAHEGNGQDLEGLLTKRLEALSVVLSGKSIIQNRRRKRQAGLSHDRSAGADHGSRGLARLDDVQGNASVTDVYLVTHAQ